MAEQAKADVEESHAAIDDFKSQVAELERRRQEIMNEIHEKWAEVASNTTEVTVVPKKADIFVTLFGAAWMPYYIIRTATETIEIPAFGAQ